MVPNAWHLDPGLNPYGQEVTDLMAAERMAPVYVSLDKSLRPKIIDSCGMTCNFCHNEGTPVAGDNRGRTNFVNAAGLSGRVSIFTETNGVSFLPGKMKPDENFAYAIATLREGLGLDELHLTGGEPTLHPQLPQLIRVATREGFDVSMTSNGENGSRLIADCAEAGLRKINFSIFGTTPEELASVQHSRFGNTVLAAAKIDALHKSIAAATENGIDVGANIVMPNLSHASRIRRVLDEFEPKLALRVLPDLDAGSETYFAIYKLLSDLRAQPVEVSIEAGSSNAKVRYILPDGKRVYFKQIRPVRMSETCSTCRFNNPDDCKEGYYGVRLYIDDEGQYKVGVCLQRMDLTMPLDGFIDSPVYNDVRTLREKEYKDLLTVYPQTPKQVEQV